MDYIFLFLEGLLSFISPCILPLIPVYISIFAAGEANRKKTIINSIGFIVGFTLIFTIYGAFAGSIGMLLRSHMFWVNLIGGIIVILFGLNFLGVIKIGFLNTNRMQDSSKVGNKSFFSYILFGLAFSVGWTPCVGAFLGTALVTASTSESVWKGIFMLFVYSLGLGLPFLLSALLIDQLKGAFDFVKKHYKVINMISGIFLIIIGVLMATGLMGRYFAMFQ